jgi:hypothetical protein
MNRDVPVVPVEGVARVLRRLVLVVRGLPVKAMRAATIKVRGPLRTGKVEAAEAQVVQGGTPPLAAV